MTGLSVHNPNAPWAMNQDSIYGVTGIAVDRVGKTSVGLSGIARAWSAQVERSVGIYAFVDDTVGLDYQTDPLIAGGVFDANIDRQHSSLDSTYGVVGLSGFGGDHAIGVYGFGRGDSGDVSQNTYGLVGEGGASADTNVGVLAEGSISPFLGTSIAAWFREGKTVIQDTLQVDYGNPSAGEFLKAVDAQGNAVWDTVPAGGSPITLQNAYGNGNSISLNSGAPLRVDNNANNYHFLYMNEGDSAVAIGHQQPINAIDGSAVSLHVTNAGDNPGQMVISAGSASATDAVLGFSENIAGTASGYAEIRWDGVEDQLVFARDVGGTQPMLAIQGGPNFTNGVLIGGNYAGSVNGPPTNGLLVEDTVGIGTQNPAYKFHVDGRSYSVGDMIVSDTAEYRYETAQTRFEGFIGSDLRPSAGTSANSYYTVNSDGHVYFASGMTNAGRLSAPLNLPDGAVVDSIVYHVYDGVSGNSMNLEVQEISYGTGSVASTISSTSVSTSGAPGDVTLGVGPNNFVINNQASAYRILVEIPPGPGSDLAVYNVKVYYTVEKAD